MRLSAEVDESDDGSLVFFGELADPMKLLPEALGFGVPLFANDARRLDAKELVGGDAERLAEHNEGGHRCAPQKSDSSSYGPGDLPDIPDSVGNFSAGVGDVVSFGITNQVRNVIGGNERLNKCSTAYRFGEGFGTGLSLASGWAGGARSAVRGWANYSHSAFPRRFLKTFDDKFARWLNRKGNRFNGDFIDWRLHEKIDLVANTTGKTLLERALNPPFGALRRALNRIPYFPGSVAYAAGSLAINEPSDDCSCK